MKISTKAWTQYITKMSRISRKAADLMQEWVRKNGFGNDKALLDYAYALSQHYGKAIGALSCQMYEATAAAQGVTVPPAEIADLPEYGEVAKTVHGTMKRSQMQVPAALERLVKLVGADTTLKNAKRDGAEFAWVPHGDTCAFCITLASRGWQRVSKETLRKGHAEHIHAHCDCEYAVRFDRESTVAGYDPEKYLEEYNNADGDINAMRRIRYQENKDAINARKRKLYADKKAGDIEKLLHSDIMISGARITNLDSAEAEKFADMYYKEIRSFSTDAKKIAQNLGKEEAEIKKIKAYLFEDDSFTDPDTGESRRFDPDCAIAQSWQRLMTGKNIKPHDKTLVEHELLEMKIKEENPEIDHRKAHELASEKYNYPREVLEYYGNLKKHKEGK
nr:MAG TPA: minor capsid protein 2 [Caudoviricetes sp.]